MNNDNTSEDLRKDSIKSKSHTEGSRIDNEAPINPIKKKSKKRTLASGKWETSAPGAPASGSAGTFILNLLLAALGSATRASLY